MRNDSRNAIRLESERLVRRAVRAIALEVNYQRANAISNAAVDIHGSGGLRQRVEFGRDAEFDTVAPILFSDPTADPLDQIETWTEQYEEKNGFRPETVLMSNDVRRMISSHPKVVLNATRDENAERANASELARLFGEYNLPEILPLPTSKVKKDNLETGETEYRSLFDKDSLLFLPRGGNAIDPESSIFGRTMWGRTLSADTEDFGLGGGDLAGVVAAVIEEGWPSHLEIIADAIAMPVVFNPNFSLKAKVV
jgi:hypothetical protein